MKSLISIFLCTLVLSFITARPAEAQEFTLGPDDVLEVIVSNHEDLNKIVTIQADGTVTYPDVGTFKAAGKSCAEISAIIKTALERTRNKVEVLVSPKEIHSQRVRVLGAVKLPGQYDIRGEWHVMDLIDAAGGLAVRPAKVSGRVIRNRTDIISVDIVKADTRRASEANVRLQRDDLVLLEEIDTSHNQVTVMGCVAKPGMYELDDLSTPLSVIIQAGNPTDKASLAGIYVTREGKQIPLNMTDTFQGHYDKMIAEFKLKPGDQLYIPESKIHFAVMGLVGKPGQYPYPEAGILTVMDAMNLAGGSNGGNTAKAGIIRTVAGKATVIPVNIDEILKKGDLKKNVALQPNDVLYVPAVTARRFSWPDVLAPITALGIMGLRF